MKRPIYREALTNWYPVLNSTFSHAFSRAKAAAPMLSVLGYLDYPNLDQLAQYEMLDKLYDVWLLSSS